VSPLVWEEWKFILAISFPVVFIDEVIKLIARFLRKPQKKKGYNPPSSN
jgi:P-type Ca2+ transporter type 2A